MKHTFRILSIFSFALIVTFTSCKKDDAKTPKDNLTAGNWTTTAMTIDPGVEMGGTVITDVYDLLLEDCTKDDWTRFETDGTVTDDEGATKCYPDDPQTITDGTWTLSDDGLTLTINYPNEDPEIATIVTLNETTLVVTSEGTLNLGGEVSAHIATVTMSK